MSWGVSGEVWRCTGGGYGSGGRALTTKVRGPRFNPGGCRFFTVLKIFPSLSSCTAHVKKNFP